MTNQPPNASPKIFISYAWENQATAKQLQQALQAAGAEVFIDYNSIRGGDILPIHISRGLDWCDTLILLWSQHAKGSHWVQLEWTSALATEKNLIPCKLDDLQLPTILRGKLYVEFKNFDLGFNELFAALRLKRLTKSTPESQVNLSNQSFILKLRSLQLGNLGGGAVKSMLTKYDFYCKEYDWNKDWCNPQGKGIKHDYELLHDGKVVVDHTTSLMWQQAGSPNFLNHVDAEEYIRSLNKQRLAGYTDWRLPTLEEAMSLMEAQTCDRWYIDSIFNKEQLWIWTGDMRSDGVAWVASFRDGLCASDIVSNVSYVVRAVRGTAGQTTTYEPKIVLPVQVPILKLRSQPIDQLSREAVNAMLKKYDFYCAEHSWNDDWRNPQGKGIKHNYELQHDGQVVVDYATGLMWQQSGSPNRMIYGDAENYIRDLNNQHFVGYNDWRLPTLEEAMSLMEAQQARAGRLYIDPVFDGGKGWIWTADEEPVDRAAWAVTFLLGDCSHLWDLLGGSYVRAVRAGQTIISDPKIVLPVQLPTLKLRSQLINNFTKEAAKAMLKKYDFYCAESDLTKDWCNPQGKGIKHDYELRHDGKVVFDHATGLMWQQAGSPNNMKHADTGKYILDLNKDRLAGYNDWRLPTLEEAMSLMESQSDTFLFIDPIFDRKKRLIWTGDMRDDGIGWMAMFIGGICTFNPATGEVRAVRIEQ